MGAHNDMHGAGAELRVWLLGGFRAELNGRPVTRFATDKTRALLAYLAMESDRPHSREHLAGLLWPDQPESKALHSLRQALSALRKTLTDDHTASPVLLAERETVALHPDLDCWVDARAFQATIVDALREQAGIDRRGFRRPNIRRLEQALALYSGHFLDHSEIGDAPLLDEWITVWREALSSQMNEGLSLLMTYYERRGDFGQASRLSQRLVELAPWDEAAVATVMRLLAVNGQWSAAQQQYHACRRYLAQELGIEPAPELQALFESIRRSAVAGGPAFQTAPMPPCALPAPATSFIGRDRELRELADLFADSQCRLITIIGPGGVGKSRLAIEAAREQAGLFDDGVFFAPLDAIDDASGIVSAIAGVMGLRFTEREMPEQQLINALRPRTMLLALDNFEHLVDDGAGLLARILGEAPGVVFLLTSRERTNLQEEWLFPLDGLDYARADTARDPLADDTPAFHLFTERARRVNRAIAWTAEARAAVARICQMVDGLPLGIELAAAATWQRSCETIAREIARTLDVLNSAAPNVPARQRSLRATFDHSFALLSPDEQACLACLSVFRGGFTREAAAAVVGPAISPRIDALLSALLDKSLLSHAGTDRRALHPAIQQYAAEKLAARAGDPEASSARHAAHYTSWLATLEPQPASDGPAQQAWLEAITRDLENVRQAWHWSVTRRAAAWVRDAADPLYRFFQRSNRIEEGASLFSILGNLVEPDSPPEWRAAVARGLTRLGLLLIRLGRLEQAQIALAESLRLLRSADDPDLRRDRVMCLNGLANAARKLGLYTEVVCRAERALAEAQQIDDQAGAASAWFLIGQAHMGAGDLDAARLALTRSLDAARRNGDPHLVLSALNGLGDVACSAGDYATARDLFEECLRAGRELGDDFRTAMHLNNLATVYHVLGQYQAAQTRYRDSLTLCRQLNDREGEAMALANLAEVAIELGDLDQARADGRQALQLARQIQDQWMTITGLTILGEVACLSADWPAARLHLREALALAWSSRALPLVMKALLGEGRRLAEMRQPGPAAELLALVAGHEAAERDIRDKAAQMAAALGASVPAEPARSLQAWVETLLAGDD